MLYQLISRTAGVHWAGVRSPSSICRTFQSQRKSDVSKWKCPCGDNAGDLPQSGIPLTPNWPTGKEVYYLMREAGQAQDIDSVTQRQWYRFIHLFHLLILLASGTISPKTGSCLCRMVTVVTDMLLQARQYHDGKLIPLPGSSLEICVITCRIHTNTCLFFSVITQDYMPPSRSVTCKRTISGFC